MNEMMDLIDRSAILNKYQEICMGIACIDCPFKKEDGGAVECAVEKLILDSSVVDAEPVKHGHWIMLHKTHNVDEDNDYDWRCSGCNHVDCHNINVEVPYCWHCGAKMDEEEDEDETN